MKYFKKSDFIGQSLTLFIDKKTIHQTIFGGILSILVCFLTIAASLFFGMELWKRNNPIVNSSTEVNSSPDYLVLDKTNWDFFFGLQYNNKLFIDRSIYTIKGRLFNNVNNTLTSKYFNIEPCTNNSFSNSTIPLFKNYFYNGAWCVSNKQDFPLQLNKLWGQEGFSYIDISIWPCVNGSSLNEGITCAQKEKIKTMLEIGSFSIYTMVYYFQSKTFESPYLVNIFNDFYSVSMTALTHVVVFLGHTTTISDEGWLFQQNINYSSFFLDRVKANFYIEPERDGRYLRFQYQLSNLKEVNTRKYLKIQELAAQIGGVANLLIICSMIVNYFLSQFYLKQYLVNLFFDLNLDYNNIDIPSNVSKLNNYCKAANNANNKNEENQSYSEKSISVAKISKFQNEKTEDHQIKDNIKINNDKFKIPTLLYLPKRRKINFSLCESIFFCCLSEKKQNVAMLKSSFRMLREYLSVENFLEMTRNIAKLRFFLFSNYENDLLDKMGNPTLNFNKTKTKSDNLFIQMSSFINKHNLQLDNNEVVEYKIDESAINNEMEFNPRLKRIMISYNQRPESYNPMEADLKISTKKQFFN